MEHISLDAFLLVSAFLHVEDILHLGITCSKLRHHVDHDRVWEQHLRSELTSNTSSSITRDCELWDDGPMKRFCRLQWLCHGPVQYSRMQGMNEAMMTLTGVKPVVASTTVHSTRKQSVTNVVFQGAPGGCRAIVAQYPLSAPVGAGKRECAQATCSVFPGVFPVKTSEKRQSVFAAGLKSVAYFELTLSAPPGGSDSLWDNPMALDPVRPCVAVGIANKGFGLYGLMPGWDRNSFGFHGDDGKVFHGGGTGENFSASFGVGDTVGCGILYQQSTVPAVKKHAKVPAVSGKVFFTRNGEYLGVAFQGIDLRRSWYPCVGIDAPFEIALNFGTQQFVFDIDAFSKPYTVENIKGLCELAGTCLTAPSPIMAASRPVADGALIAVAPPPPKLRLSWSSNTIRTIADKRSYAARSIAFLESFAKEFAISKAAKRLTTAMTPDAWSLLESTLPYGQAYDGVEQDEDDDSSENAEWSLLPRAWLSRMEVLESPRGRDGSDTDTTTERG